MTSMPMLQQLELGVGGQVSELSSCNMFLGFSVSVPVSLCVCLLLWSPPLTLPLEDHSFVLSIHCFSFLLSSPPPPGVSQAVKGPDFSAPVFCSLSILLCFPLPRHCSYILFILKLN
jgi:hypothetical protein